MRGVDPDMDEDEVQDLISENKKLLRRSFKRSWAALIISLTGCAMGIPAWVIVWTRQRG